MRDKYPYHQNAASAAHATLLNFSAMPYAKTCNDPDACMFMYISISETQILAIRNCPSGINMIF